MAGTPPKDRNGRTRSVAELVPKVGGQSFRRFGFNQTAVLERWAEIVGETYARHSRPESLGFPRGKKEGGTLRVAVSAALAPMLRHVEPQIVERVNRLFGYAAVAKLALTAADIDTPVHHKPANDPQPLAAETASSLKDIADPGLRASLESLARALSSTKGPPVVR